MSETISIMFDENGIAKEYDDTFDITIHCESEEEQNKVLEILNNKEEKTGHWEYVQYDGNPNIGNLHCSECERIAGFEYKYCPNCGARMVEQQEKSEYEHDHEVVKAYNDGQAYILDKIRREIEEDIEQVEETVDYDDHGYGKTGVNYLVYLVDVLEVIDKYREVENDGAAEHI